MTFTLELADLLYAFIGLAASGGGAYVAIRADLATHAANIADALAEAREGKEAALRCHVRVDDHVKDWHRTSHQ